MSLLVGKNIWGTIWWTDRQTARRTDRRTDGPTDWLTDGPTDWRTDRRTDARVALSGLKMKYEKVVWGGIADHFGFVQLLPVMKSRRFHLFPSVACNERAAFCSEGKTGRRRRLNWRLDSWRTQTTKRTQQSWLSSSDLERSARKSIPKSIPNHVLHFYFL